MAMSMKKVPDRIERPVKELVGEFYRHLGSRQVGKRYITAIRLALNRYQVDHGVTTFREVKVEELFKYRGMGPQAITLLWDLYGNPGHWAPFMAGKVFIK